MPANARGPAARSLTRGARGALLVAVVPLLATCGGDEDARRDETRRDAAQTEFESAPPVDSLDIRSDRDEPLHGVGTPQRPPHRARAGASATTTADGRAAPNVTLARPEETDIYRVDGERLYVLNVYRGLLVFDISDLDDPRLLGRLPVEGVPVQMLVRDGFATIVLDDHHRSAPDGSPALGSAVRTIDARNPAAMTVAGEVPLEGSPRDTRIVGDKLFVLSETADGPFVETFNGPGIRASKVIVSSVSVGGRVPTLNATRAVDGRGGVFRVTPNAILVAYDLFQAASRQLTPPVSKTTYYFHYVSGVPDTEKALGPSSAPGKSALDYLAISPLDGSITLRGRFQLDGTLDRDGMAPWRESVALEGDTACVLTCNGTLYGSCLGDESDTLVTIDFSQPSAPVQLAAVGLAPMQGTRVAAFSGKRLYRASSEGTWSPDGEHTSVEVYDLTNPAAPALAGATEIRGVVSRLMPLGTDRLLVLGSAYNYVTMLSDVALRLLDVSDAPRPSELGVSTFDGDWTSRQALAYFTTVTRDDDRRLIALSTNGRSASTDEYLGGVQLVEYDADGLTTRGSAHAKGWLERGVFLKDRLVALSDEALSVIDYTDRGRPRVVRSLTLARDVASAQPEGATIVQVATDRGHELPRSVLRVLPLANAEENTLEPSAPAVSLDGYDGQVFRNGDLAYVVTTVDSKLSQYSTRSVPRVQVVDLSSDEPTLRGAVDLPEGSRPLRWAGRDYATWHATPRVVQVGGSALAFRRMPGTTDDSAAGREEARKLYVVDLSDPDRPSLASTLVAPEDDTWWGNVRVVGDALYATHYEHATPRLHDSDPRKARTKSRVRYYLDRIDLTDRARPTVAQRINVPGLLVGASEADPSLLYFVDYRWHDDYAVAPKNELAAARLVGDEARLESTTPLDGWVGGVFLRGARAYASAQEYTREDGTGRADASPVTLLEIDLSEPARPIARASRPAEGLGWLVDVEGERALFTSRWGEEGLDVYALRPGQVPAFVQFVRTGWIPTDIARHGGDLYLSTGYWGLQRVSGR
ncbi:MAG: beta-propeller domain-containing protein [Labilithrix sp.]|nr:beta-propeller domain-containing protein [Labilithrix sp.]